MPVPATRPVPPALVIQTAFLGDVVLTTPLLEALARRHGPVDVVTTPAAVALVETHPAVRRVISYDKRGKDRGLAQLVALARTLRAERYAVAYLPHRSLRTAALAWLARIPKRVGFRDGWPLLYTDVRQRATSDHEIDRLLALATAREDAGPRRPSLRLTSADRTVTEQFLREHGVGETLVALAPGSIWGSRTSPSLRSGSPRARRSWWSEDRRMRRSGRGPPRRSGGQADRRSTPAVGSPFGNQPK